MWTEGSGTGMAIMAKIIRYVPTDQVNTTNMTTNATTSQDIGNSST